jgi:hypothetical protein
MKIQEALEDITEGGILIPSSKTSYMEENIQKEEEIGVMGPKQHSHAPRHMLRRLAQKITHICACRMVRGACHMILGFFRLFLAGQGVVLCVFVAKCPIFYLKFRWKLSL